MIIKGADEEERQRWDERRKKKSIPFLFVSPAPLNDQHVLKPNASTMRQGGGGGGGQKLVYLGPSESQPSGVNKSILITGHSNHSGMTRSPSKCF